MKVPTREEFEGNVNIMTCGSEYQGKIQREFLMGAFDSLVSKAEQARDEGIREVLRHFYKRWPNKFADVSYATAERWLFELLPKEGQSAFTETSPFVTRSEFEKELDLIEGDTALRIRKLKDGLPELVREETRKVLAGLK